MSKGGTRQDRADLHTHTVYSDGVLSPAELIRRAHLAGLTILAITDHDTVDGIDQAVREAEQFGIEIIPAIELSASLRDREVHLLGYFIDRTNPELLAALEQCRNERVRRAESIVKKLNALSIPLEMESVMSVANGGVVARPHIARALVNDGLVPSYGRVFNEYIGDTGPAYVKKSGVMMSRAIELIRNAGGLSVLAHPAQLFKESELRDLIDLGIDGIEVYHPSHSPEEVRYYRGIAGEYYLLETGGSDFHGGTKERDEAFGTTYITGNLVTAMRNRLPHS